MLHLCFGTCSPSGGRDGLNGASPRQTKLEQIQTVAHLPFSAQGRLRSDDAMLTSDDLTRKILLGVRALKGISFPSHLVVPPADPSLSLYTLRCKAYFLQGT